MVEARSSISSIFGRLVSACRRLMASRGSLSRPTGCPFNCANFETLIINRKTDLYRLFSDIFNLQI